MISVSGPSMTSRQSLSLPRAVNLPGPADLSIDSDNATWRTFSHDTGLRLNISYDLLVSVTQVSSLRLKTRWSQRRTENMRQIKFVGDNWRILRVGQCLFFSGGDSAVDNLPERAKVVLLGFIHLEVYSCFQLHAAFSWPCSGTACN